MCAILRYGVVGAAGYKSTGGITEVHCWLIRVKYMKATPPSARGMNNTLDRTD